MIVFSNHLGHLDANGRHVHLLRDWSGAMISGNIIYPPMEMLYAAAYLRSKNHEAACVDGNARHDPPKKTIEEIRRLRPDYVATISGWFNFHDDLAFFRSVKEAIPGCRTIMAGPNVTLDPIPALQSGAVDFVAPGEHMDGILEILTGRLSQNVAYLDNGVLRSMPTRVLDPVDQIPYAAWDLIDSKAYWAPFLKRHPFALAVVGYGCPHGQCAFCHQISYFGPGHRSHSPDYVKGEADHLVSLGFREIIYRDQVFTAERGVVEALCRHLIARGRPVAWRVSTRVDKVDRELLSLMADAGCHQISFGFESFSEESLAWCRKGVTAEDGRRAARWAKEASMEVSGGFIIGLPGTRGMRVGEMLRRIREYEIDFPQFFVLSHVFDRSRRAFVPVHEAPAGLEADQRFMRKLALRFYFHPRFLLRHLRRFVKKEGLRRLPSFLADFLRYFL